MTTDSAFLVELFHHRWSIPILASLGGGARVAELAHALGASRGGLRQAIDALARLDLIGPNRGHGHPLRPEFVITARGRRLVQPSRALVRLVDQWWTPEQAFRKWPLPVIYGLKGGARFSEVRDQLPEITDRALSEALHLLGEAELVDRLIIDSRPPAVHYLPTDRGSQLRPLLRRLARAA
jgi:DNA-binding HxlR family transcriptional regulator